MVGGLLQGLRPLGLASNLFTENAFRLGGFVAAFIVALGVARRIYLLKEGLERSAAEKERLLDEVETLNRSLEDRVLARTAEVEAVDRRKSDFLSKMSHELRTPLNAVMGFSEVLIDQTFGELNEKQIEYLRDIHASGSHLLSLVSDILDLSKIETGQLDLELTSFDLKKVIANALVLIRDRATLRGVRVSMEVEDEIGEIVADQRKVKQVLINLLSNAVKFTGAGGRVTARARRVEGGVEIAVVDTGAGIAADDLPLLFDAYRQVGIATAKAEGTGLGLVFSKRMVERHRGRMSVESEVGRGSTFHFVLPDRPLT